MRDPNKGSLGSFSFPSAMFNIALPQSLKFKMCLVLQASHLILDFYLNVSIYGLPLGNYLYLTKASVFTLLFEGTAGESRFRICLYLSIFGPVPEPGSESSFSN